MFCGTGSIGNAFPVNSKPPAPSCVNSHHNSTPVQACATCLCLPKNKGKKHGHCQKILPRLLTTIWQRKAVWKTSFQTNPQELSTLCIYPKQLLNNTKNVSIKKTLFISTLAQYFILQLRKNIPLTTMTLIVFCFGNHAMERNASPPIQDLERHLLEHLLLNLYML